MEKKKVNQLIQKYGTPLYIFESEAFIKNYINLLQTFRNQYRKYDISYSYKTNYMPRICQIVQSLGGYAEVVSDMEYELAKKIGYKNEMIIYNGPVKGELLEEHLLNKGIVNLDNLNETERICEMTKKYPNQMFEIGLRINIDIEAGFISRFGFQNDGIEMKKAIKLIEKHNNITLVGLHCHISRARSLVAWKKRVEEMLKISDKIFEQTPKYISLGSGMYGQMEESLAVQFPQPVPTYEDYANTVITLFAKHFQHLSEKEKPILFTEPGTTLVSKYMSLLGKIDNIKTIRGRNMASLDCCIYNLGEICEMKKLPIEIYGEPGQFYEDIDLMGYTCLEQDCLYPKYTGKIGVGNYVLFGNVGGYSLVSKPPFIRPNCTVIEYSEKKEHEQVIKKSETFDDVFQTYCF